MEMQLEEGTSPLPSMLQQIAFEENIYRKMMAVDVVCSSLDDKISKKVMAKEFKKWLNDKFLANQSFVRKLKLVSRLEQNPETAIELASIDFVTHPEFHYDQEFNESVTMLNRKLNHFVGKCIRELSQGKSISFGNESS